MSKLLLLQNEMLVKKCCPMLFIIILNSIRSNSIWQCNNFYTFIASSQPILMLLQETILTDKFSALVFMLLEVQHTHIVIYWREQWKSFNWLWLRAFFAQFLCSLQMNDSLSATFGAHNAIHWLQTVSGIFVDTIRKVFWRP